MKPHTTHWGKLDKREELTNTLIKYRTPINPNNLTKGPLVDAMVQAYIKVPNEQGDMVPLKLAKWQRAIIDNILEIDSNGEYRYRQAVLTMARRNGKTWIASILVLFYLLTAHRRAGILSVATDKKQAAIVFDNVAEWISLSPYLSKILKVKGYINTIINTQTKAEYRAIAADGDSIQGFSINYCIQDEMHLWGGESIKATTKAKGLLKAINKGTMNISNSQIITISTAGDNVDTSLFGSMYKKGVSEVIKGDINGRFGFFCWQADEDDDPEDVQTWYKANPNLYEGYLKEDKVREQFEDDKEEGIHYFYRYTLNQWVTLQGQKYLSPDLLIRTKIKHEDSVFNLSVRDVMVGLDTSFKGDSTAIVISDIETGQLLLWRIWEKPTDFTGNDWHVTREEVEKELKLLIDTHNVKEIFSDPYYYQNEIKKWKTQYGWPITEISQSKERQTNMATELRADLIEGNVKWVDNDAFSTHLTNVITGINEGEFAKENSKKKIDAFIAAILANSAKNAYIPFNPKPPRLLY